MSAIAAPVVSTNGTRRRGIYAPYTAANKILLRAWDRLEEIIQSTCKDTRTLERILGSRNYITATRANARLGRSLAGVRALHRIASAAGYRVEIVFLKDEDHETKRQPG